MSTTLETRPERALYNMGVAIRLIEGVLDDLDRELRKPVGRADGRIVDHVMTALRIVERLETPTTGSPSSELRTELKGQLESLLTDLRRGATPAMAG